MLIGMLMNVRPPTKLAHFKEFHPEVGAVSAILVGVLAASFYLAELLLSPIFGILSDRLGHHRVMLWGPMFGVMLDEPGPEGECAFYVALADDGAQGPFEAWWLDCEGARIREVPITDFEITPIEIKIAAITNFLSEKRFIFYPSVCRSGTG